MWVESLRWSANTGWQGLEEARPGSPHLVLLFGPTDVLKSSDAAHDLAQRFPDAIQLGCSTGTTLDGLHLSDETLTATCIGFGSTRVRLALQGLASADDSRGAGETLGRDLAAPDLAAVFVLSEGLGVNGSSLVEGLNRTIGEGVKLGGGLAGDGARFTDTLVTIGGKSARGVVAAVGFYGADIRVAQGSAGGWDEFGPLRTITESSGNVLSALDGKAALDLYERYLGDEANALPASALFYPLKVWNPAHPEDAVVRTVLSIDRGARTMTFAGDVPTGWHARLMRGSFDHLTNGAAEAARMARDSLPAANTNTALCLFVSCVGRRLLMGQRAEEEVEAVAQVLGAGTQIAGFYSYGEIGPNRNAGFAALHNQTVTLTLLAEAA